MGMQLIETIEVGAGGAASIEFTGIPQDGVDLVLVTSLRNGDAAYVGSIKYQFNSDTGLNYSWVYLRGNGAAPITDDDDSDTEIDSVVVGATATSNTFSNDSLYISNYSSATSKSISLDSVTEDNATNAVQEIRAANFATTVGITSLLVGIFGANFVQYSTASLYKITAD